MSLGRVLVNNFKAMPLGGTIDEQFLNYENKLRHGTEAHRRTRQTRRKSDSMTRGEIN